MLSALGSISCGWHTRLTCGSTLRRGGPCVLRVFALIYPSGVQSRRFLKYCVSFRAAYRGRARYFHRIRFSFVLLLVVVSCYCWLACSDILTSPAVEAWWRRVCSGCESDAALVEMWAYAVKLADVPRIVIVNDLSFRKRWVQPVSWRRRLYVLPKRRRHSLEVHSVDTFRFGFVVNEGVVTEERTSVAVKMIIFCTLFFSLRSALFLCHTALVFWGHRMGFLSKLQLLWPLLYGIRRLAFSSHLRLLRNTCVIGKELLLMWLDSAVVCTSWRRHSIVAVVGVTSKRGTNSWQHVNCPLQEA